MKNIIILLILSACSIVAAAQDRINRVIKSIEHNQDVEMTYTERRTPKNHKVCRITKVLNFYSPKYYEKLVKAFEDERENTVSAMRTKDSFIYHFEDNRTESKYTLQSTPGRKGSSTTYTFVMTWRNKSLDKNGNTSEFIDRDGMMYPDGEQSLTSLDALQSLESLRSLESLKSLESLEELKELRRWGDEVRRVCRHQTDARSARSARRDDRSRCRTITTTDDEGNTTTFRYYGAI